MTDQHKEPDQTVSDMPPTSIDDRNIEQGDDRPDGLAEADFVYLKPESTVGRRALRVAIGFFAVLALLVAVGGFWLMRQIDPGGAGAEVSVVVPLGSTTAQIGRLLEDEGVITNATVFQYYTRWKGGGPFEAGVYDGLRESSSMDAVLSRLAAGPLPPVFTEVPIPEGFWQTEIRARILEIFPQMSPEELDLALGSVRSAYQPDGVTSLEGLLFPATYRVEEGDELDEQKLVRQMVSHFDEVGAEIGLGDATARLAGAAGARQITPFEAVIVASMIEEEAGVPEEKARIARVIYNRLAQGIPLGVDATVIYALGEHTEDLTRSQLDTDSPYNTRRYGGLPPGPIASPGRASLEAALNPAEGDWLYYVLANEDGSHYFTNDYDDFLRAGREARDKGLF